MKRDLGIVPHSQNQYHLYTSLWWCDIMLRMDESDKKHVGEALRRICAVHRVKYGTDVFAGMWAGLQDMSRADFDRVVPLVMKTSTKGMPYPAEFFATERKGWL